MSVFEKAMPSVAVTRSSFGGGWAVALNAAGTQALHEFFGDEPVEQPALGGTLGYIVEPYQAVDLAEHLRSCNCEWEIR